MAAFSRQIGQMFTLSQHPWSYAVQMASATPSDISFEDRRSTPRVAVALPAFLQAGGVRHSVQLLDLSAGGAKLDCLVSLPSGTPVTLDCGSLSLTGVVRWQGGGALGLSFDRELDPRDVGALAKRSSALEARMQQAR